ncbi:signal peptidase I [Patescibacteria group bacterium]|nr:signal peptidase I [Patescibacteria group bacterium]
MPNEKSVILDDVIKFALIALLIVVPLRWFVAQPFVVRGASMEPIFENGEYLIVDQLTYRFEEPERDDVVILRYPKDPDVFFIKRIIGLPGETVELQGKRVIIRRGPDTEPIILDESFISPDRMRDEYGTYALGEKEYFVMGDNRNESSDSRAWGSLPRDNIVGRPLVRLFPPTKIEILPGDVVAREEKKETAEAITNSAN